MPLMVILERAVPHCRWLKPVQRRILHSMKDLDDGRYNKVANIVGHTMQYHPHGDARSQTPWCKLDKKTCSSTCRGMGEYLTGDRAAASLYWSAFVEVCPWSGNSPKVTDWQLSYDGRKNEPVHLPVSFHYSWPRGRRGLPWTFNQNITPQLQWSAAGEYCLP